MAFCYYPKTPTHLPGLGTLQTENARHRTQKESAYFDRDSVTHTKLPINSVQRFSPGIRRYEQRMMRIFCG
jgi:hypothetical protein